jgi:hypothetical protein
MPEPVIDNLEEGQTQITPETPKVWYDESVKDVVAKKGWKNPNEVVKSYSELEKSMGSRVKIPALEAPVEEKKAFYQKIGCPETVDGYEISGLGEDVVRDEIVESSMRKIALENFTPKESFNALVKGYYDLQNKTINGWKEESTKQFKPEEITIAARFCDNCGDEFKQILDTTGLGNHPTIIKAFIELGKKTMNDSLIRSDGSGGNDEKVYEPKFKDSPDMYKYGEDEESVKARAYFVARGHKY